MTWIRSDQSLGTHPTTYQFARLLKCRITEAVGILHFFWWWAVDAVRDGNIAEVPDDLLKEVCRSRWPGAKLRAALTEAGFVDTDGSLHDWDDHLGKLAEYRAKETARKRRYRNKLREEEQQTETRDTGGNKTRMRRGTGRGTGPGTDRESTDRPETTDEQTTGDRPSATVAASPSGSPPLFDPARLLERLNTCEACPLWADGLTAKRRSQLATEGPQIAALLQRLDELDDFEALSQILGDAALRPQSYGELRMSLKKRLEGYQRAGKGNPPSPEAAQVIAFYRFCLCREDVEVEPRDVLTVEECLARCGLDETLALTWALACGLDADSWEVREGRPLHFVTRKPVKALLEAHHRERRGAEIVIQQAREAGVLSP